MSEHQARRRDGRWQEMARGLRLAGKRQILSQITYAKRMFIKIQYKQIDEDRVSAGGQEAVMTWKRGRRKMGTIQHIIQLLLEE